MIILRHRSFDKQYEKIPVKIKLAFREKMIIFSKNELDPLLNNHSLHGEYADKRSIDVTGNYRALFRKNVDMITFTDIGTHSQLYE